jgi:hypothetical protein
MWEHVHLRCVCVSNLGPCTLLDIFPDSIVKNLSKLDSSLLSGINVCQNFCTNSLPWSSSVSAKVAKIAWIKGKSLILFF